MNRMNEELVDSLTEKVKEMRIEEEIMKGESPAFSGVEMIEMTTTAGVVASSGEIGTIEIAGTTETKIEVEVDFSERVKEITREEEI